MTPWLEEKEMIVCLVARADDGRHGGAGDDVMRGIGNDTMSGGEEMIACLVARVMM